MGYFYTSYYSLIQNVFGYTDMEIANLAAIQSFVGAFGYLVGGFIADNIKPKISITIAYAGLCVCGALAVMRSGYMIMQLVAVGVSGFGLALFCVPMMRYISTLGTREQAVSYTHLDVYKRQSLLVAVVWIVISFSYSSVSVPKSTTTLFLEMTISNGGISLKPLLLSQRNSSMM